MKRIIANANNVFVKFRRLNRIQGQAMPYYAVAAGWEVGIFETWEICEGKVKGYSKPKYKKFNTVKEAEIFLKTNGVDVKSKVQAYDPKISAVPLFNKLPDTKPLKGLSSSKLNDEKNKPTVFIEESWPDEFECSEADNYVLLTAVAEVEGIDESINTKKRPSTATFTGDSKILKKLKKYEHDSKIWEPIGLKKIGNFEFPIDCEGYIIVYTDGSCINNGKRNAIAGYGVYFSDDHPLNAAKPVKGRVTNNAGEIQAAIHAIQLAKDFGIKKLCLCTDSQFLINAVTSWIKGWKRKGWKLASGEPVKNADDFSILDKLLDGSVDVKWNYVRGHQGIEGNEKADQLARKGADEYGRAIKKK